MCSVREEAFEAAALLIVLRLWRVVRIINGKSHDHFCLYFIMYTVHTHRQACTCTHTHTCTHSRTQFTHKHTHIHTHTHTHIGVLLSSQSQSDKKFEKAKKEHKNVVHALHKAQDKMDEFEVRVAVSSYKYSTHTCCIHVIQPHIMIQYRGDQAFY